MSNIEGYRARVESKTALLGYTMYTHLRSQNVLFFRSFYL
jgi:hypothetical protein